MNLLKYQNLLFQQIKDTVNKWSKQNQLTEHMLYEFLHKMKGTAGSVGLTELATIAAEKIATVQENSEQIWYEEQWSTFLNPIIEMQELYDGNNLPSGLEETDFIKQNTQKEFILIIDDDIVFISYFKSVLEEKGYAVIVAHNGERGIELIYEIQPAIVFIDMQLPDISGLSILKHLKTFTKDRMCIAIISAYNQKENRIQSYELGAMDFIAKPIDQEILIAYVENRLLYLQELKRAIIVDELTNTFNRKYLSSQLAFLLNQYQKNNEVFSLALLDLDFFKTVNDRYGHLTGDEVLRGFSQLVMNEKRPQDIFFRYGGEEFVLLMPNTRKEAAQEILETLRYQFMKEIFIGKGKYFNVTFSAGITEISPQSIHQKALLEAADKALYAAKEAGRNRTVIFHSELGGERQKLKLRVIVVDDVALIRKMISNHFKALPKSEQIDMEVLEYGDGLTFLNADWYDPAYKYVILLDWMMPNINGIDVLKEIREKYSAKDVIVSMLTGRKGEEDVLKAFENGADDYILKPFQVRDVSARILSLAERLFI